jgi:hypothetical protein
VLQAAVQLDVILKVELQSLPFNLQAINIVQDIKSLSVGSAGAII